MQKDQLAKIAGLDTNKVDFALPQAYFDFCLNNHINTNLLVCSYEDEKATFGQIKNIAEEFIYNSQNKLQIDFYKLMKFLEEEKKELNKTGEIKDGEQLYITLMELIQLIYEKNLIEIKED